MTNRWILVLAILATTLSARAHEYHVSTGGNDAAAGSRQAPFRTIMAAAERAQPGDVIMVHEGTYRERIDPPRGGASDTQRIVYQAAPGEAVVVKGSEIVRGWSRVTNDTWKVTLPDSFFGAFNPYKQNVHGDWFGAASPAHHLGIVYHNGHWLTETAQLADVMKPAGDTLLWFTPHRNTQGGGYLLNVAWLTAGRAGGGADDGKVPADRFTAQQGVQTAPCSEGGKCIGWIEDGDWVTYAGVDFGDGADTLSIRAAAPTEGGLIDVRLGTPTGTRLGTVAVTTTGDWQKWATFSARIAPTAGKKDLCLVFRPHGPSEERAGTTIYAQLPGADPNTDGVELNVREAVFYPEKPGINYITVRGFTMEHASPNWAPPTAEQVGLIGTHWSKGWIIENNTIRYSICTGVTLGKYGDEWDNRAQSAVGYVGTINRALTNGWSKENIGHHIVRGNHISFCEQAGIVGSMGAVFSVVTSNTIHDINLRGVFGGAEQAGIKFHGAIDTVISRNHIYRSNYFGIWLDWMAQGTRVTGNLLHENRRSDLFVEVNHGPFLVDNNIMLSSGSVQVNSQGGAYVHNLFAGNVSVAHNEGRQTPYHPAHSTDVAGLARNPSGDDRYYNNLFVGGNGLTPYDAAKLPVYMDGNVFLGGASPSKHEKNPLVRPVNAGLVLTEKPDGLYLEMAVDRAWSERKRPLVTTELLGRPAVADLAYERPDGSPYRIDGDYFGASRNGDSPFPGPFEVSPGGRLVVKVWPADIPAGK